MIRLKTLSPRLQEVPASRLKVVDPSSWRGDKTSTQRGYGYKWQKARERYLANNPLCVYCQCQGRVTEAAVVDHIEPHRGDKTLFWAQTNWQALCRPCHDSVKRAEETSGNMRN